ncbi:hypothetical protein BDK51DRAFT_25785 [Blyttiomyces helicus]|uniref:Uncharacterized protein n=1 Tax=Blyttiomyces helicus TaxID=388810 RepID=A0A4P9WJK5_9FUNG|nr:hypothetical protein BDK51DRAFT_25785 [Blyttiomyces helicus]|eukprot:RKO91320.1 hypothetical protein BDK51DRAFT_25785 [Blyttiomyces helicus]
MSKQKELLAFIQAKPNPKRPSSTQAVNKDASHIDNVTPVLTAPAFRVEWQPTAAVVKAPAAKGIPGKGRKPESALYEVSSQVAQEALKRKRTEAILFEGKIRARGRRVRTKHNSVAVKKVTNSYEGPRIGAIKHPNTPD